VPIRRGKSADQLYEESQGFDLVIVPDAPLADALNRRLDRPHFGPFAITPRRLATRRREEAEDRLAFLEVIDQTDLSWKQAAYDVGNILQCWEYQGKLDSILEYDAYANAATRTVVNTLEAIEITSRELTGFSIDDDQSVAVVGRERLTPLEASILPGDYTDISQFTDDSFEHPPFRIFDSSAAIVDTVLDSISVDNADEFAIVLDQASAYSSLIESGLEAAGIPYYGGPGFIDQPTNRGFLQLLRAAYAGRDMRVKAIRPILSQLGAELSIEHDDKRVIDLDHPAVSELLKLRDRITTGSIGEAIEAYERATGSTLELLRTELERLGVYTEPVSELLVNRLHFYFQTYEVPIDRDNEGVLLADAKAAAHVGRPVVFYLGLDEGWTHQSPRRPWVDNDAEYVRNIQQFQLLLQNGVEQHFLVQDAAGGQPITPCLYFEELLDEDFERFSDLESSSHAGSGRGTGDGFDRTSLNVDPESLSTLSQSSLNSYVNSPRDYFFGRLVDTPDADYFVEGNLFHDFAEFYVSHPEFVGDAELESVIELLLEETAPYHREPERAVKRTTYRAALEAIVSYFDANPPEETPFLTPVERRGENDIASYFDRPIESHSTERWFENESLGIKGKIDLVHGPTRLLDHKSGSKKSASEVVKNAALEQLSDTPNFQALMYLTHYRTVKPNAPLSFTFFHFTEIVDDLVRGDASLDDCLTTVRYQPKTFEAYIEQQSVFDDLQNDASNDCEKTFSQVDYDTYREVVAGQAIPSTRDSDELIESPFGQALIDRMRSEVGDYKYVTTGCKQALRQLTRIRSTTFFTEDLDAFEAFVDDRLNELNERRAGCERFPVEGLGGDPNERRLDHHDLILEGEIDG
jgi:hypothetical protein